MVQDLGWGAFNCGSHAPQLFSHDPLSLLTYHMITHTVSFCSWQCACKTSWWPRNTHTFKHESCTFVSSLFLRHTHTHTNTHSLTHSHTVPPEITGQSGLVTILENDTSKMLLRYSVSGVPPPHYYQWLRNGSQFHGNNRVKVVGGPTSSLEVRAPSRQDSGNYTLVAISVAGQVTLTVKLQIVCKLCSINGLACLHEGALQRSCKQ